jgi:hypothetical protein
VKLKLIINLMKRTIGSQGVRLIASASGTGQSFCKAGGKWIGENNFHPKNEKAYFDFTINIDV